jgi:protein involved in polysaccharide export with SLBB domain
LGPAIGLMALGAGCNSILNGWLDPTVLGRFNRDSTLEIRSTLSLEDDPPGIPGERYPVESDLELVAVDYPISAGDVLNVEIHELRDRQAPFQVQAPVASAGYVNLPVVGKVNAAGLTVPEFERALVKTLQEKDILRNPDVTVNPQFLQRGTYSVFGIGVSAADNSPLRAGTFPIRRPDLRVLEAINLVGGLNEFVTDVYIFRYESVEEAGGSHDGEVERNGQPNAPGDPSSNRPKEPSDRESADRAVQELFDAAKPTQHDRENKNQDERTERAVESLTPDATHPFLWINNEWVANPAHRKNAAEEASPESRPGMDPVAPSMTWARIAGDVSYHVIRVPAEMLRMGDPQVNVFIRAGDVIRVVSGEIGVYYVMGQVARTGSFSFNAEPVTLKAAIVMAGGLSGLAWPDRCTVYRRLGQREQMIQVNLDRIFAGKDPDFLVKRGDIINVGTHPFAPFLQRIRAWTLPNPVNNVGYSFTYSRNFADIDSFSVRQNPHNEPDRFPALFP